MFLLGTEMGMCILLQTIYMQMLYTRTHILLPDTVIGNRCRVVFWSFFTTIFP